MPYTLSIHAQQRIAERGLVAEQLAAALAGSEYEQINGHIGFLDRRSRCLVVVNPSTGDVVTAYRLKRKQLKRRYSR